MASIDLGGAPANADCAQLGHTPDFDTINRLEVELYCAALIACYGKPPAGVSLDMKANVHDFGTYRTAALTYREDQLSEDARDYIAEAENGLTSWLQAGFAPPITYRSKEPADLHGQTFDDIIRTAIMSTRPNADGSFFPPNNEQLHSNLKAAFPDLSAR